MYKLLLFSLNRRWHIGFSYAQDERNGHVLHVGEPSVQSLKLPGSQQYKLTERKKEKKKKKRQRKGASKYAGCVLKVHHKLVKKYNNQEIQQSRERRSLKVAIQSYRVHKESSLYPLQIVQDLQMSDYSFLQNNPHDAQRDFLPNFIIRCLENCPF